jgi:hypothetical protein
MVWAVEMVQIVAFDELNRVVSKAMSLLFDLACMSHVSICIADC